MRDWLWHLFNDPMRDNPWSLLALAVILGLLFASLWSTDGWRTLPWKRRRRP